MKAEIPPVKLQEDIHAALKSWHDTTPNASFLDYLQLFQQAKLEGITNARRATNSILLDALEVLAIEHESSTILLRQHFLDGMLMQSIANRLNIGQSTAYRKQQEALAQLTVIIQEREVEAKDRYQSLLEKRLKLPPEANLIGVEAKVKSLLDQLLAEEAPWLTSLEGLGGIGKTAMANAVVRHPALIGRFQDIAWVSAKQREFFPGLGLESEAVPALTIDSLIESLLEQLGQTPVLNKTAPEKRLILTQLLKQAPYLIVIDNLETLLDYETLLPLLWEITDPSKLLITSRHSLYSYPEIFCLTLTALDESDTFQLVRNEAGLRGLPILQKAADDQLQRIYEVVGGNPLAVKLVVGQTAFLPMSQVLDNLKMARGSNISDLYTHIYWQAWEMMVPEAQQTLLVMPLTQKGTLAQLLELSQLEVAELHQALQQLATLSLVQVEGGLDERRYAIHRLTETFLLNEAIAWQSSV